MDSVPTTIAEQFALLFDGGDDFVLLKKEALSGRLKQYDHVHFLAWQVLLGVLSTENPKSDDVPLLEHWKTEVKAWRQQYAALKSELVVTPSHDADSDGIDVTNDNPLSTGESSTWAQYFANSELRKDIFRDVDRTYPEIDFFREGQVQDLLTMVLFVYAKQHPDLAYKQGMHEICALPFYIIHRERILRKVADEYVAGEGKKDYKELIQLLYDPQYLEHDLYHLFSKILQHLGPFYHQSKSQSSVTADRYSPSLDGLTGSQGSDESASNSSAVLRKCKFIQDILLKKHDEMLSSHLASIELEPQLYLLRWIRILFGREFHLEDTVTVWDAVFAYDDHFGFIDHMAVSMLIFIRSQLLNRDFADCIRRLQKYPPVEDVTILVEHAIALTKRPAGAGPLLFGAGFNSTVPTHTPVHGIPTAPMVTVSHKTSSAASASANATRGAEYIRPTPQHAAPAGSPQKPIVYASPHVSNSSHSNSHTGGASTKSIISTSNAISAIFGSGSSSSSSSSSSSKRSAAGGISDAQILKATPLHTPPHHASRSPMSHNETPMVTVPKAEWEELNKKVADGNMVQLKLAEKLNTVITGLQTVLTSSEDWSPAQLSELLVMTVAGLKKVRDISSGLLPTDDDDEIIMPDFKTPPPISYPTTPATNNNNNNNHNNNNNNNNNAASLLSSTSNRSQPAASSRSNGAAPPAITTHHMPTTSVDLLPPAADTDEWVFTPSLVPGKTTMTTINSTTATRPSASRDYQATPTAIDIPASSEASKAVVSSIFD